jgi:hypothetical protein
VPKSQRSVSDYANWGRFQNFPEQINSDAFDKRRGIFPSAHLHYIGNEPGRSFGHNDISGGVHQTYLAASRSISELRAVSFIAASPVLELVMGVNRIG